MKGIEGKIGLVTGGSRGIGRAIAISLAHEGANVAVNYVRNRPAALSAVEEIRGFGTRADAFQADTSKPDEVQSMVDAVVETFGRVDILVNNAGVLKRTPFLEITEDEWDQIVNVNLKGYFSVSRRIAKLMIEQGGGCIVNVSSIFQDFAAPNLTHYSVAKAGVAMLTKQMALELAPFKIRVNAVAPGLIETDLNRADIANPAFRERRLTRIPLREVGKPQDVTGAVLFLVSDEARFVTGSTIFIDGGATIGGS